MLKLLLSLQDMMLHPTIIPKANKTDISLSHALQISCDTLKSVPIQQVISSKPPKIVPPSSQSSHSINSKKGKKDEVSNEQRIATFYLLEKKVQELNKIIHKRSKNVDNDNDKEGGGEGEEDDDDEEEEEEDDDDDESIDSVDPLVPLFLNQVQQSEEEDLYGLIADQLCM